MSSRPEPPPSSSPPPPCACSVFIATSLDGFIADKNNKVDWLNDLRESHPLPEGEDGGFSEFLEGADAIVMGRVTYETVLGFVEERIVKEWPYGSKPLYVLTRTPGAVRLPPREDPVWKDAVVRPVSGPPASVLSTVAEEIGAARARARARASDSGAEGGGETSDDANDPATRAVANVYIDGGGCIRSFLDAGLVTSAVVTVVPVTLGDGVPLFSEEHESKLREVASITLANGFVQTTFEVA